MSQITTLGWPFACDVEAAVAAGVPALGVSARKLEVVGLDAATRCLSDAGLAVSCLTAAGPFPLGDPAGEEAALAQAFRHLDAAATLGAGCLMLIAGGAPRLAWEEAAARARPLLEALLPAAERCGVRLAVEPTSALRPELSFLHSLHDALDFVDAIASPWLGVVLEVNNAWTERRLYANIRERVDRIALVQLSDFRVGTLCTADRVVMGDGDIPLRRIVAALDDAGYRGWYDIEILGPAVEAEGYAAVVPRAVARFHALWT